MLVPSIFRNYMMDNFFDGWFEDKEFHPSLMSTDVKENENDYTLEIELHVCTH